MSEKLLERCTICCGDIYYSAADAYVTCPACGNTQAVALFQREKNKLQEALKQGKQAQEALTAAQVEKQAAQERLNKAVSALGSMDGQLQGIAAQLGEDRKAFEKLLSGLQGSQDTLLAALRGPGGAQEKLQSLQKAAQQMLAAQQGNAEQLKGVQVSAQALLDSQRRFDTRIDALQTTADETQKTLNAFYDAWKQQQLDKLETLYHQAENFRGDRTFDKAEDQYRKLQAEGAEYAADPEIFWRMLLCHYGVEYQYSDAAEGYIPTIYRPDLSDPKQMSLRKELFSCCDQEKAAHYQRALSRIDEVLDEYRRLRAETHYDVFLSVKQADNYGHHTTDSDKASTLYDQLTGWGLKVFNSRRTIIPAGQAFEPHIIAALMSAKVMIVVGTKKENVNAEWVRNEWTRFQWLQKDESKHGKSERVLFCYLANGMQPHQLPAGLNPSMQAIVEDSSAGERLRKTMKDIFPQKFARPVETKTPEPPADDPLKQMRIWLMLGQYQLVQDKYNEMVQKGLYLDNIYTHLNALCAAHQVADMELLIESDVDLSKEKLFVIAMSVNRAELPKLQEMLHRNEAWRNENLLKQEAIRRQQQEAEKQRKAEEKRKMEEVRKAEETRKAEAARKAEEAAYEYDVLPDNTVAITKYKGQEADVVIPSRLGGKKVTRIGKSAFEECKSLLSVKVPAGVTSLDHGAFFLCNNLHSIELPEGLVRIDDSALRYCGFKNIRIPQSVTHISRNAFNMCSSLQSVELPEGLVSLGESAFHACIGLQSIKLPDSLTEIRSNPFDSCGKLSKIKVSPQHPVLEVVEGVLFDKKEKKLLCYPGGLTAEKYVVPQGVLKITQNAFWGAKCLREVILLEGVREIADFAFAYLGNLTVTLPDSITSIGNSVFFECKKLKLKVVKGSKAHAYAMENKLKFELLPEKTPQKPVQTAARPSQSKTSLEAKYAQTLKLWDKTTFESEAARQSARASIRSIVRERMGKEKLSEEQGIALEIELMEKEMDRQTKRFVQRVFEPAKKPDTQKTPPKEAPSKQNKRKRRDRIGGALLAIAGLLMLYPAISDARNIGLKWPLITSIFMMISGVIVFRRGKK